MQRKRLTDKQHNDNSEFSTFYLTVICERHLC